MLLIVWTQHQPINPSTGTCIFKCDKPFRDLYPVEGVDYTRVQVLVVLQEKRDAITGKHRKDKCRCTIMGYLELAKGKYTEPLVTYYPSLGMDGLRYLVANAAWKQLQVSCIYANQAFQHTTSTFHLKKELTGEDDYLTTLFPGLPEASRAS